MHRARAADLSLCRVPHTRCLSCTHAAPPQNAIARLAEQRVQSDKLGDRGISLFPEAARAEMTTEQLRKAERLDRLWNFDSELLDQLLEELPWLKDGLIKSMATSRHPCLVKRRLFHRRYPRASRPSVP